VWDNPTMTVITDAKKRVTLPGASPGDTWDLRFLDDNRIVLHRLTPAESKPEAVRFEKRGRMTVGVNRRPVNPAALAEALAEFP